MNDGGSGVCNTMQVRLMSLPLLMYSSELPLIFAFDTNNIIKSTLDRCIFKQLVSVLRRDIVGDTLNSHFIGSPIVREINDKAFVWNINMRFYFTLFAFKLKFPFNVTTT